MSQTGEAFEKLVAVMRTLRSPDGCPWDREQTLESLTHFVLEEAHEVVDAIERGDMDALREEIGDHIFEGVFLAQVAAESGLFTVDDSLRTVVEKLVRRHPHVFQEDGRVHDAASKQRAPSAEAALDRWNALKAQERAGSGAAHSTLGSVPKSLPSLLRAYKIGKRVASVGFDWATTKDVVAKIEEEVAELRETLEQEPDNAARAEEEMGDLLFAIANLSRKLGIEPEAALRKANEKFTKRFNQLEENFERNGRTSKARRSEEMEAEWERIKATEYTKTTKTRRHEDTTSTKTHERHERRYAHRTIRLSPPSASRRRSSSAGRPESAGLQIGQHLRLVDALRALHGLQLDDDAARERQDPADGSPTGRSRYSRQTTFSHSNGILRARNSTQNAFL